MRQYTAKDDHLELHGIFEGEKYPDDYNKHSELQNNWNKAFWARGYYIATIGNLSEEAIKKYIAEQSEESRKEDSEGAIFLRQPVTMLASLAFQARKYQRPLEGHGHPHLK